MPAKNAPKKLASNPSRLGATGTSSTKPESMFFGRGFEAFASRGIGVPRPLKGAKAVEVAIAAGIITPSGELAKRYR